MLFCPKCGAQNEEGWESCVKCQRDLVKAQSSIETGLSCLHCGREIEREWSFCPGCGQGIDLKQFEGKKPEITEQTQSETSPLPILIDEKTRLTREKSEALRTYRWLIIAGSLILTGLIVSFVTWFAIGSRAIYTSNASSILLGLNKTKADLLQITATLYPQEGGVPQESLVELRTCREKFNNLYELANKLKPPSEARESHKQLVETISQCLSISDKLVRALENNDAALYGEALAELDKVRETQVAPVGFPAIYMAQEVTVKADLYQIRMDVRRIVATEEPQQGGGSQQAVNDLQVDKEKLDKLLKQLNLLKPSSGSEENHQRLLEVVTQYQGIVEKLIRAYQSNDTSLYFEALRELDKAEQIPLEF